MSTYKKKPPRTFAQWVESCDKVGTEVWPIETIEGREGHGLYLLKKKYQCDWNYYYTTPVYRVWIDGKDMCTTEDLRVACSVWEENKGGTRKEDG